MLRLIDLANQAAREGRHHDSLLYLQEVLAVAETLPQKPPEAGP